MTCQVRGGESELQGQKSASDNYLQLCTVYIRMSEGLLYICAFQHWLLWAVRIWHVFVCVYVHVDSFTQMSKVTAVNEYALGFTHTSNCPTISNVKVCLILLYSWYKYIHMYVHTYLTSYCIVGNLVWSISHLQDAEHTAFSQSHQEIHILSDTVLCAAQIPYLPCLSVQLLSTAVAMTLRRGCICRQCRWSMKWLPSTWT